MGRVTASHLWVAVWSVISVGLGVAVNEACAAGDYKDREPTSDEYDALLREVASGRECEHQYASWLKGACSAAVVMLVAALLSRKSGARLRDRLEGLRKRWGERVVSCVDRKLIARLQGTEHKALPTNLTVLHRRAASILRVRRVGV